MKENSPRMRQSPKLVRRADTGNDNPSTDVDILVKRLFEIAAMRDSGHLLLSSLA